MNLIDIRFKYSFFRINPVAQLSNYFEVVREILFPKSERHALMVLNNVGLPTIIIIQWNDVVKVVDSLDLY